MNAPGAARRPEPVRVSAETLLAFLAPLLSGALSLRLGADFNYDLRHYHFYNGYALVHGRFDQDLAPAGLQSFFNPLQDALYYLGIRHLPPRLFGFLLGALHGLNVVLVHRIARRVLTADSQGRALALLAAILAGIGSNALSLVGTTTGDLLVVLPLLLALLLLCSEQPRFLAAGLAAGVAAGLKLTMLVPGVALAAGLLAADRAPLAVLPRFALGSVLGFLATGGFWCERLLERFANPVFPFLNGLFHSPFFRPAAVFEPRFVARGWWEALSLPLEMAMGWTSGLQEIRFREPRFLLAFLALLGWLLAWARRRGRPAQILGRPARLLMTFWLAAWVLWAYGLHYYRYAAALELLAPVVLFVLLRGTPWGRPPAIAVVVIVAVLASRPVSWGRLPWSDDWFGAALPPVDFPAERLVIVAGERAAYLAPFFPEATRFVGLTRRGSPGLDGLIALRLGAHRGPVYLLAGVGATPDDAARFGLVPAGECQRIATRDGGLCLYPLRRTDSADGPARRPPEGAPQALGEADRVRRVEERLGEPEPRVLGCGERHRAQVPGEESGLGHDHQEEDGRGQAGAPPREGHDGDAVGPGRRDLDEAEQGARAAVAPGPRPRHALARPPRAHQDVRVGEPEEPLVAGEAKDRVLLARYGQSVRQRRGLVDLIALRAQFRGQHLVLPRGAQGRVVEADRRQRLQAEGVAASLGEAHGHQLLAGVRGKEVHQVRDHVQLLRERHLMRVAQDRLPGDGGRLGVALEQVEHGGHVVLAPEAAVEVTREDVRGAHESQGLVEGGRETQVVGVRDEAIVGGGADLPQHLLEHPRGVVARGVVHEEGLQPLGLLGEAGALLPDEHFHEPGHLARGTVQEEDHRDAGPGGGRSRGRGHGKARTIWESAVPGKAAYAN